MTKLMTALLSVIAVGVLLIAYGLLRPVSASDGDAQPMFAADEVMLQDGSYAQRPIYLDRSGAPVYGTPTYAAPVASAPPAYTTASRPMVAYPSAQPVVYQTAPPVAAPVAAPAPRRAASRSVDDKPARGWKKSAMIIGGSSAAGAGIGGILGGKKGALIGAAIGGGASTIYETTRD